MQNDITDMVVAILTVPYFGDHVFGYSERLFFNIDVVAAFLFH